MGISFDPVFSYRCIFHGIIFRRLFTQNLFVSQVLVLTTMECWYLGQQTSHGPLIQPLGDGNVVLGESGLRNVFGLLCSLWTTDDLSDLRRGSTSHCLRSTPAASCSNSIWVQPPTVSPSLILILLAKKQMVTQAQISA